MSETGTVEIEQRRPSLLRRILWKVDSAQYKIKDFVVRVCLKIIRWSERDSNYIKHAQREFEILYKGMSKEDLEGPNTWILENILDLLAVLGIQGHSGGSIGYCLSWFEAAARFRCLSPLTGADDEWGESFGNDGTKQNKRMSEIFKDKDGRAYMIYGYIFREPNGSCFTDPGSRKYIEFPYTYKEPEYIPVDEDGNCIHAEDALKTGRRV